MKIALINMLHYGSTGKIMFGIAECAKNEGHIVKTFSPKVYFRKSKMDMPEIADHMYFGFRGENMLHIIANRLCCMNGCFSLLGTWQLIRALKRFRPDVIHLHNLHNQTVCIPLLLRYIRRKKIKTVWTLHDCWTMTGRCPHFIMAKCDKWKTGCGHCPQLQEYPKSYIDLTGLMWKFKKQWFDSVSDMVIVTPSKWLAGIAQNSYLHRKTIKVIHNGIDLDVFKPTNSDFREKHNCIGKKIVLGVSFAWGPRKGLDVFVELSKKLSDDYVIVLVGTDEKLDQQLPENIISIHRTRDQKELAEIYSAADVFVNPTREDTFPTVNIEALACGTPVITFETGGSPEIIDETCGNVIPCDGIEAIERSILSVIDEGLFSQSSCVKRASQFKQREKFHEYLELYEQLIQEK